ncbi:MAG: hypothetical protein A2Z48_02175 [Actinobacteria bacterium RBG_19FT_COMBO_70_19]|jgi:hypothetical protein|nr:MAG: hypothetical protein A2Z48_02175 [Actinobacteria bacterium RBG_19FT_COMBO_70_19]
MTSTPEDIIRDALRHDPRRSSSEEGSREALAALDSLVGVRDELSKRLLNEQAETLRLHRIEEAATRVLNEMGGRRSATPMLAAIAELRAALKEQG